MTEQMFHRFHRRVQQGIIRSFAQAAAVNALNKWDGRGSVSRFVLQRTRWAVLDGLRKETRQLRGPAALASSAAVSAEKAADAAMLADEALGFGQGPSSADALQALVADAAAGFTVELDAAGALAVRDPREDVEGNVDRIRLRRAVERLPEPERSVLDRHGYGGESFEEIGQALKMHKATVFSCYSRALQRLRAAFEGGDAATEG
ncbi:MAG: sigma-70 family RNA polymerase sigma factor [Polyangiaceae bacterium]|nr:sigma-70 family RNA polymerase sigma factor [Polyangiaceae bacterium]